MRHRFALCIITAMAAWLLAIPAMAQPSTFPTKVEQPWFMQARTSSAISVTTSTAATILPAPGFIAWMCNTGSNDAYLTLGTANTVTTSLTVGSWLKSSTCAAYDLYPAFAAAPYTYVALIGSGGSTTVYVETGAGQPGGTAGGGGGGGGSGCVGTSGTPCIVDTNASGNLIGAVEAGTATTGTAVPSSAIYLGVNVAGNLVGMVPGTAGTPSTQVWTIQGNASGTPVPVTVSSATGLAQGSTTAGQTGSLVMCAVTTSPVTFTNLQTDPFTCTLGGAARHDMTSWAGTALGAPSNFGTSPGAVAVPGVNAFAFGTTSNASSGVATGAVSIPSVSYNYGYNGTTWDQLQVDASKNLKVTIQSNATATTDPCASGTHQFIPISQTTNTQIAAAGSAGTVNYICGYKWVAADAENISLVEGTGSVCATDTTAIDGGTTAAAGPNYAANSGAAGGTGRATLTAGTKTAHAVCLFQSGSGRVAGFLNLVQQ